MPFSSPSTSKHVKTARPRNNDPERRRLETASLSSALGSTGPASPAPNSANTLGDPFSAASIRTSLICSLVSTITTGGPPSSDTTTGLPRTCHRLPASCTAGPVGSSAAGHGGEPATPDRPCWTTRRRSQRVGYADLSATGAVVQPLAGNPLLCGGFARSCISHIDVRTHSYARNYVSIGTETPF